MINDFAETCRQISERHIHIEILTSSHTCSFITQGGIVKLPPSGNANPENPVKIFEKDLYFAQVFPWRMLQANDHHIYVHRID